MAGSVTFARDRYAIGVTDPRPYLEVITITWTGDAADGTVPNTDISGGRVLGVLQRLVTDPGATAPTTLYDITILDEDGFDVLGGAGANRSATVTEEAEIAMSSFQRITANVLNFRLANNSVASATGTARLYVLR